MALAFPERLIKVAINSLEKYSNNLENVQIKSVMVYSFCRNFKFLQTFEIQ